jgi:Slime mold cyclic AMP receptor
MLYSLSPSEYACRSIHADLASLVPSLISAYRVADIVGFISFLLTLSNVAAQRLFPEKCNGNMQKTSVALAISILNARCIFTLFRPPVETLCSSAIESAASTSNWRCALQGFMVMFGAYSATLWASLRLYEVFAMVVFGYTRSTAWLIGHNLVCWGAPLAIAVGTVATGSLSFIGSYFCGPRVDILPGLLLYPLIVCAYRLY